MGVGAGTELGPSVLSRGRERASVYGRRNVYPKRLRTTDTDVKSEYFNKIIQQFKYFQYNDYLNSANLVDNKSSTSVMNLAELILVLNQLAADSVSWAVSVFGLDRIIVTAFGCFGVVVE